MIEIDIILGSKYVPPWRQEMICTSGAIVLIIAKTVLANYGINGAMAWSIDGR
jgi:hypothetical protein